MSEQIQEQYNPIAWMGKMPSGWNVRRIKYLADLAIPHSFDDGDWIESPYITDAGIRYITSGNIGDGYYKEQGDGYITPETYMQLKCKSAYPGDLIFSRLNRPFGRSCILPNDFSEYVIAVDNVILRSSVSDKKYICYVSQCAGFQKIVEDKARGTAMQRISRLNLGDIFVPFPPISEQQQIAAYLDDKCAKIDEAITKHRTLIEKLKEYRKAVITKAVTKGLDPNVEMKDSGVGSIGLISKSANVIRMKFLSLCPITDGTHQTPEYDDKENGCPFLSSKDITSGKIDWNNIKYITKQLHEILYKTVSPHKGDILLAKNGTTGIAALVEDEKVFDIYVTLALIRPDTTKVISKYLLYAINCSATKEQFNKHLLGIGVPNLHLNVIDNTYIVIHDISIQEKIVSFLDTKCAKIDEAIACHEGLITKLEEYKKSIIYNAVTGKIDCRKDAE